MPDHSYNGGMQVRRQVLGDAHVDRVESQKSSFDADFQHYITESVWCGIWGRQALTLRERSMLTIGVLAALGHHDELALHIRATRNTGATLDDVKEVLLQVAAYAGVPASNGAYQVAKATYAQMGEAPEE